MSTVIQQLAAIVTARLFCLDKMNAAAVSPSNPSTAETARDFSHCQEMAERHADTIADIERRYLPHGSGIDCGTKVDLVKSSGNKLVLNFGFHHMDRSGYYCGWSDNTVTIRPHLQFLFTLDFKTSGQDQNSKRSRDSRDYYYNVFHFSLCKIWQKE
jgi:hypothetical protein